MKGKIIKPQKNSNKLISSILLLILGIILITNSNQIVTIAFQIIGIIIIIYGLYRIFHYISLKKQFKMEDNDSLITGIISITIGILLILLASIIEVGLRYLIGFFLILNGLNKIVTYLNFQTKTSYLLLGNLFIGIILILFGLYTIFIANAALIIVGIILTFSAIWDIVLIIQKKK